MSIGGGGLSSITIGYRSPPPLPAHPGYATELLEHLLLKRKTWIDSQSDQTKHNKKWYAELPCLTFSVTNVSAKPPPCVVDSVVDKRQLDSKAEVVSLLSRCQVNLVKKIELQLR